MNKIENVWQYCFEQIEQNEHEFEENKWVREYAMIAYNGNNYHCQLSIKRVKKSEKQRKI